MAFETSVVVPKGAIVEAGAKPYAILIVNMNDYFTPLHYLSNL